MDSARVPRNKKGKEDLKMTDLVSAMINGVFQEDHLNMPFHDRTKGWWNIREIQELMFRLLATDRRSRSRRKGQGMTRISWPSCPFSARFGHTRRCAKLLQNRWHDTTYLSRGDDVTTPFPRPVQGEPKAASQHQLVHGRGYHHAPALELFCGTHMHFRPQQILFEKTIAVLMGKAPSVGHGYLRKRQLVLSNPDKPAFARIAFAATCPLSQDPKDRHLHLSCLAKVQVVPGLHLNWLGAPIGATPGRIWLAPGL